MSGQPGTIVELEPYDGLGWIELDDGERVRFGGTSLQGFNGQFGVGTRVEVQGTEPGFRGVTKASRVVPLPPPGSQAAPAPPPATPWPTFVREHPRWSDATDTVVPCLLPAPALALPTHPLFAPWHREICDTAPTTVALSVPSYQQPDPFEPGPRDCFAHGRVAFLDEARWPSCGICSRPLEMCLQLSPAVVAAFLPGGRGLAVLFCFHCGTREQTDPRVAHVRLVEPRFRAVGPESWESESSGWLAASQRVTPRPPAATLPSAGWYRHRSEHTGDTAASGLFGYGAARLAGPFPRGVDPDRLHDLGSEYDKWIEGQPRADAWGGSHLGGVSRWDQADDTPSCDHGAMLHLLDYNGGQFLDGALHVFACRERACDLAFVAEF